MSWAKIHTEILGDLKLRRAAKAGCKNLELLPWLLVFAKHADDDGRLSVGASAATAAEISALLPNITAPNVSRCIESCLSIDILVPDYDGVPRFRNWQTRQGKASESHEAVAARVRRHRERRKETPSVTPPKGVTVTPQVGVTVTQEERRGEEIRGDDNEGGGVTWESHLTPEAREALAVFARAHPRPASFRAAFRKYAPGGTLARCTWPVFSRALETLSSSAIPGPPGEPLLVRFIDAAKTTAKSEVHWVTGEDLQEHPATKNGDGSWHFLTPAERQERGV